MIITSKYKSPCKVCGTWTEPGDPVGWQPGEKGVWCLKCVPTAVQSKAQVAGNGKTSEPWLIALAALEEAIVAQAATQGGRLPEMERSWSKYQKLKALALNPGTEGEGRQALKLAVIEAIKLAF